MKKVILGFLVFAMLLSSLAANAQFRFGIDKGVGQIGPYSVKSCRILIPDMGAHTKNVISQLRAKGYKPEVSVEIEKGRRVNKGEFIGSVELHNNPEFSGYTYVAGELLVGLAAIESKLRLEIAGEQGAELARSNKYTMLPGRESAEIYSVESFPNCKESK